MDFIEGSRGIYKPVRVLFGTPIYDEAKQMCWHKQSFRVKVALLVEFLRLQQSDQLPSELTVEDMVDLMVEDSKKTVRMQLWEFNLESFDEDVKPLLKLVWEVNTSMLKRDVEFEARRQLESPDTMPPSFKHPRIISQAQEYVRILVEQLQEEPVSKLLGLQDVIMTLVPRVLQGFWRPKKTVSNDTPSEKLSDVVVGVTKAVLDRVPSALHQVDFSRSVRDNVALSIDKEVRQMYPSDTLSMMKKSFDAELLNVISTVTARHICELFEPPSHTIAPTDEPQVTVSVSGDEFQNEDSRKEPGSTGEQTPHLYATLPAVVTDTTSALEGENMEDQSIKEQEPAVEEPPAPAEAPIELNDPFPGENSVVVQPPLPYNTLPAEPAPASVPEGENMEDQSIKEPEPAVEELPAPAEAPIELNDPFPGENSVVVQPPLPYNTLPAEPAPASVPEGENMEDQSIKEPEPAVEELPAPAEAPIELNDPFPGENSVVVQPPLPYNTLHAEPAPASVLEGENMEDQSIKEPEPAVEEPPAPAEAPIELNDPFPGENSVVVQPPLPYNTLPAEPAPASVLEDDDMEDHSIKEPEPAVERPLTPPESDAYQAPVIIKAMPEDPPEVPPAAATIMATVLEGEDLEEKTIKELEPAVEEPPALTQAPIKLNDPFPGENSVVVQPPLPYNTLPAVPAVASILEGEFGDEQSIGEEAEVPKSRIQRFLGWFQQHFCC